MFRRVAPLVFLALAFVLFTCPVGAQVAPTGTLTGTVTDPQGNAVPGAIVSVVDESTGVSYPAATTGAQGEFTVNALNPGTYTVTITKEGFKKAVYKKVKIVVSEKYDLTAKLELGEMATTVVVEAGQEVIETQTAQIGANITGKSIVQLPFTSHNLLDLAVLMPGASTAGTARATSFNGLPRGAMNITYDGINVQDNLLKSNDGFFAIIRPSTDAVEEFSIATAGNGADQAGEGAVQIHFETKRGGNAFHGGGWEYLRNDYFNSNYYFSSETGLPRQVQRLNQFGGKVQGPIIKDKLFFFVDIDNYRNPQSRATTRTILAQNAVNGLFTYKVSAIPGTLNAWTTCTASDPRANNGPTCTANLAQFGAANPAAPFTPDPYMTSLLSSVDGVRSATGVTTGAPLNPYTDQISFNAVGGETRRFPDARFDWQVSKNHSITAIYHYSNYTSTPDFLNSLNSVFPNAPFNKLLGSQISNRYEIVGAWRWNLTPTISNEVRFGLQSSLVSFFPDTDLAQYPGATTNLGTVRARPSLATGGLNITQPFLGYNTQGRNTPLAQLLDTFTWSRGTHSVSAGLTVTDIRFHQFLNGGRLVQNVNIGLSSSDPATGVLVQGNFPGITTSDLTSLQSLYVDLTGHVSSYTGTISVNPSTAAYQSGAPNLQQVGQHEWGIYVADSWRMKPSFTFTYGLRFEYEGAPFDVLNEDFATVGGAAGLWGPSGLNNLFKPGTTPGSITTFQRNGSTAWWTPRRNNFAPNIGFAWQPNFSDNKLLRKFLGGAGKTVVRAGYSIAFTREGLQNFNSVAPGNPGVNGTINANPVSAACTAGPFTGSGSYPGGCLTVNGVLTNGFMQALTTSPATYPATGTFAITPFIGQQPIGFAPNLRTPYVQSWSVGIQREISPSTVFEFRYVGNHSVALWRLDNINEVNIFENGFLQEFKNAVSNMTICTSNAASCVAQEKVIGILPATSTATVPVSTFANLGLAGQVQLPIITAAFNGNFSTFTAASTSSSSATRCVGVANPQPAACNPNFFSGTFTTPLGSGGVGTFANTLATGGSGQFICNLAGSSFFNGACTTALAPNAPAVGLFPVNFFTANPQATSGSFMQRNASQSTYNALQIELRRRPSKGLQISGSYTFSKALSDYYGDLSNSNLNYTTLRNSGYDKSISPWNLTHQFKLNAIYDLPFGPGRKWNVSNGLLQRVIEGWSLAGINRWQSGRVFLLTTGNSNNFTFNQADPGVRLIGLTQNQLQAQLGIRKTTNSSGQGVVFYFPASLIGGNGQANTSFIAPCTAAGQLCNRIFLTGPGFFRTDLSITKTTRITERVNVELRAEALNAFNNINFYYPGNAGSTASTSSITSSAFGQVTAAFQDPNTTNDNGGRILQLVFRVNF